ncbi:bifunctional adenosylcobinamide kinase/adenosylcobinamide-phosphate guanylyltransferase [Bacillus sp. es.036]|uniref:bifunctional adenosylcobinamide kinase/adenosylcobinamide-phosphate guanylyltransferase n=1 Tax=Bacillus sp. es.036 TaxID=1761764 RepID=UPI000C01E32D|nr:bifunctional adenosylcobinamide kinase/adenosylcobinamide-phosphate guanylyltransferase [Bacillus sp. es.036]PFG15121.1 adenosylcobinamide kinase /adenosylcobinamide-phosphate guanylyltransferase [Bacillus sp. es.036]
MAKLIFITGGVRSGKSRFAEKRAASIKNGPLYYLASGQPSDDEMQKRIARHQHDRASANVPWETVECATDIGSVTPSLNENAVVLLDCVTTLLSNELFRKESWRDEAFQQQTKQKIQNDIEKLNERSEALIIVSNELGYEPLNGLVDVYARQLGELHQWIVSKADEAYLVENGVPQLMKGEGV